MNLRISLNLQAFVQHNYTFPFSITFKNIENMLNWYDEIEQPQVKQLELIDNLTHKILYVFLNDDTNPSYNFQDSDIIDAGNGRSLIFDCVINDSDIDKLLQLIEYKIVDIVQDGITSLFLFMQNSQNNMLNKSLTFVGIINGNFKNNITLRVIDIDIINYAFNFNYVYVAKLKRYYYVDSIELITKDITRLHLKEDALMSWRSLIKSQKCLVSRYELSDENYIIDERLPLESRYQVAYDDLEDEEDNSLVNFAFNFALDPQDMTFLVTTTTYDSQLSSGSTVIGAGGSHGLPNISPTRTPNKHYYTIDYGLFNELGLACNNSSADASFVLNVLYIPFKITDIPQISIRSGNYGLAAGNKELSYNHTFESGTAYTYYQVKELTNGNCPYLVLKDFYFNASVHFTEYDPYTQYDLYIPFVGWIPINLPDVEGDRCIIYYSLDFDTGSAVAHLYNITDEQLIWSGECQLGIKMEMTSGNIRENRIQRELNGLKMGMEMLNGGINAVAGYASGNYAKMAGGIASFVGAIPKGILQDALIMNRTNVSLGTPENSLYAPDKVKLRITYRPVISNNSQRYARLNGLPYNHYVENLNELISNTYVEIGEIQFDLKGEVIFQDEVNDIIALLRNGVII